jgi:hypothetical protein
MVEMCIDMCEENGLIYLPSFGYFNDAELIGFKYIMVRKNLRLKVNTFDQRCS